jgi:hypothetical protein
MPNWTTNSILIHVPTQKADALREALRGPAYHWATDGGYNDSFETPMSQHEVLKYSDKNAVERVRAAYLDKGMPDWMQVTPKDVKYYTDKQGDLSDIPSTHIIPISLVKQRPWAGPEEYEANRNDLLAFQRAAFGCKWTLSFAENDQGIKDFDVHEIDGEGITQLFIRCDTAWCEPSEAPKLLQKVLAEHSAKMLWIFVHEGNEGAGCFQVDRDDILYVELDMDDVPTIADPEDPDFMVLDDDGLADRLIEQGATPEMVKEIL